MIPLLPIALIAGFKKYTTLNPSSYLNTTLSNGNLTGTLAAGGSAAFSILGINITDKRQAEITLNVSQAGAGMHIGLWDNGSNIGSTVGNFLGSSLGSYAYNATGSRVSNSSSFSYGATFTNNDVIGIYYDATAAGGSLTFYKNGVSQGVAYTGLNGTIYYIAFSEDPLGNSNKGTANFGASTFAFPIAGAIGWFS